MAGLAVLSGCATTRYPDRIVHVGPEPEIEVTANAFPAVGKVLPVRLSVENKRSSDRMLSASSVIAIAPSGERVEPMSVDEAATASGDADALRNSLTDGGVGAKVADALIIPPAYGVMAGGQAAGGGGAMLLGAVGLLAGTAQATRLALSPNARLETVMLFEKSLPSGEPVEGYVFYPAGEYRALEVSVSNLENQSAEVVTIPWDKLTLRPTTSREALTDRQLTVAISSGRI